MGPDEGGSGACRTHFVPAYDKYFDPFAEQWSTKNGIKVIIDHVAHLQFPAKIAAEIATQSGHDIVQLVGSGTEKWAAALLDVNDTADRIAKKHGGWTPLADNYCKVTTAISRDPDFFIDFPGLYRKDLWTEVGLPNGPDTWDDLQEGGVKLKAKGFPIGIGLAHHDDSRASWRAIMWSYGGSEVAKDGKTLTYNSKEVREALKFNKALYKELHDARGPRLGRRLQQPAARLGPRLLDPQPDQRLPDDRGHEQGAGRQDLRAALAQGPGSAPLVRELPRLRRHEVQQERRGRQGLPRGAGRRLSRGRQGQHRLQHAVPEKLREAAVPDHQRGSRSSSRSSRTPSTTSPPAIRGRSPRPRTRSTSSS